MEKDFDSSSGVAVVDCSDVSKKHDIDEPEELEIFLENLDKVAPDVVGEVIGRDLRHS